MTTRISDIKINKDISGPLGGLNPYNKYFDLIGFEFIDLLKRYGDLNPSNRILDIGCGTGRLSKPLMDFMENGEYVGIDINHDYIKYCKDNYKSKDFTFKHLDVYHPEFNNEGNLQPQDIELPFQDNYFDLVISLAVYNHFSEDWIENYISETSRLLKDRGVLFSTILLFNEQTVNTEFSFEKKGYRAWYKSYDRPLMNVAFSEVYIRQICVNNNLLIKEPIMHGHWKESPFAVTGHDLLVANKGQAKCLI